VVSRGAAPGGGGEVVLRVPLVKQLMPVKMEDEGERGGAWKAKGGCGREWGRGQFIPEPKAN
jgi:hypothetical protein